jgi:hypothetical protein
MSSLSRGYFSLRLIDVDSFILFFFLTLLTHVQVMLTWVMTLKSIEIFKLEVDLVALQYIHIKNLSDPYYMNSIQFHFLPDISHYELPKRVP